MLAANRRRVRRLNEALNDWFERELKKPEQQKLMLSGIEMYYYPSIMVIWAIAMNSVPYVATPGVSLIVQLLSGKRPLKYDLAVTEKFAWNVTRGGLPFFFEYSSIFALNYAVILSVSLDGLFAYYTFLISRLYRALSYNFERFTFRREGAVAKFKSLIVQHQQLIGCQADLQNCYGLVIFAFCITCATTLCTLLYQLYTVILRNENFWKFSLCFLIWMKTGKGYWCSESSASVHALVDERIAGFYVQQVW